MYFPYDLRETIMKARFFIATIALAAGALMAKDYSGAELYSKETWMYGKFEARMQMAAGSGTVSSMFLYHNDSYLGAPEPWVEIDIEILGKNPNSFQSNIITGYGPGENTKIKSEKHHSINPASNESFHTYGIEWTPDYVAWTLDGQVVRKTIKGQGDNNQVQDLGKKPQGLRFNLWSHEDAGWVGAWNDNILPVYQFINWVKVYEYTPGQGDDGSDFKLQWTDDFKTFDTSRWSKGDWTFDGNRVDISPSNIYAKDGMVIIALTKKGQESFNGQVPQDPEGDAMLNNSLSQSSSSEQFTPPSSSSEQETGILQNRIKVQNREVRGTVNAKGARVSETNRAHYQVDFNY
ncbi:family 16 glycosylhydrolase [Fibrobacter sp.]|uniref:glycoside hydrolase family 16 protein n=1 Tax=Fibrobacter sp. TaxID=35828 RepID=UPI003890B7DF